MYHKILLSLTLSTFGFSSAALADGNGAFGIKSGKGRKSVKSLLQTLRSCSAKWSLQALDSNADGKIRGKELRKALRRSRGMVRRLVKQCRDGQAVTSSEEVAMGTKYLDIQYRDAGSGSSRHTNLDIYGLSKGQNNPVVIFIHGGGWATGDKKNVHLKPEFFNSLGTVFVSINYRLIPEVSFSTNVEDVAHAIAWVHDNIGTYGGDKDSIFVMGHSAGTHLAALVSTNQRYLQQIGISTRNIIGTILLDTMAYNIPEVIRNAGPQARRTYLNAFGQNSEVWLEASPQNYIDSFDRYSRNFLLVQAGRNPVRLSLSSAFHQALEAEGVAAEMKVLPQATHSSVNQNLGHPGEKVTDLVKDFITSSLMKQSGPRG